MITIFDQIKCVKREINKREHFYPKWIESGRTKMTQAQADREIAEMQAVLTTLEGIADAEGKQIGLGLDVETARRHY